jgi:class 3 adenylate cyclase/tetratricopeptide (TPR) repeat protein
MTDVGEWLSSLGLSQYSAGFEAQAVEFDQLAELSDTDLRELGVVALGHRKRLLKAIAELAAGDDPALGGTQTPQVEVSPPPSVAKATAERRHLTVMFCDLVGSTHLAAQLDPEDLQQVVREYQRMVAAGVAPYEGHVAQLLGDGVLVYFGYPHAHEDDALRALRAGLAVLDTIAQSGGSDRPTLRARIGIASGLVVVGEIGTGTPAAEYAASGETPNLAARLQSVAQPGEIVVSDETCRLVGSAFDLESLPGVELKGFAAAVRAWRVIGERAVTTRFEAQHAHALTQLVGRDSELALLVERWAMASDGEGQVVLLSGEAGIGKSRISQALRERLAAGPSTVLVWQCSPYAMSTALYPAAQQLLRASQVAAGDDALARAAKLEAALCATGLAPEGVGRLQKLLGLPDGGRSPAGQSPQQEKVATLNALIDGVAGLAARQPVLLLLEDAHWIDPTTEELLGQAIERLREARVLILVTCRPEYAPSWGNPAQLTRLALNRLGQRQSAALIRSVAHGKLLPTAVVDEIVRKTDGIALFVEELTKTVIESGLLRETPDGYELDGPLPPLAIPSTLQDSLMARLDRLALAKEVAQAGAVIGREFSARLLAAVLPQMAPSQLEDALQALVRAELVFRRGAATEPMYKFKHALVRDTAYNSILRSQRSLRHTQVAEGIERLYADRIDEHLDRLGEHWFAAEAWGKAADCLTRAGQRAASAAAFEEAAALFDRALQANARLGDGSTARKDRLRLLFRLHDALLPISRYARLHGSLVQAEALAGEVADPVAQARALGYMAHFLWIARGDNDRAFDYAVRSINLARARGRDDLTIAGQFYLGQIENTRGNHEASIAALGHNIERLRIDASASRFDAYFAVTSRTWSVWVLCDLGRFDEATKLADQALAAAQTNGDTILMIAALQGHTYLHYLRGDFERAVEVGDRAMALPGMRDHTVLQWSALIGWTLAGALLGAGQIERGTSLVEEVIVACDARGVRTGESFRASRLAEAYLLAGRLQEARRFAADATRTAAERNEPGFKANGYWISGLIELQSGADACESARRFLSDALAIVRERAMRPLEAKVQLALGQLERNAGAYELAAQHLAAAHALAQALSMPYWSARIDEELQVLRMSGERDV